MSMIAIVRDYLGKEIQVGHVIVYPGRAGSDLWLSKGTVTGVSEQGIEIVGESGRKRTILRTDRIAVVHPDNEYATITVEETQSDVVNG